MKSTSVRGHDGDTVLVINSGSSSIKYQLVDPDDGRVIASGLVERIGEGSGSLRHTHAGTVTQRTDPVSDHADGLRLVLELFSEVGPDLAEVGLTAVGHRVVHGGKAIDGPRLVDEDLVREVARLAPLAPLHQPPNLRGIEVARELLPQLPHVAVFDTAFFHTLPDAAATYALDREVTRRHRVRRYGFHGTSHQYVARTVAETLGRPLEELNQIVLHLGNGASASAVRGGEAVDTSMGMTPLEGLVMGTRTGDLDAAILFHLHRNAGMSVEELDDLVNRRSGLKGLGGRNDVREILQLIQDGDEDATLAMEVYLHRLRKYIGAYVAVLGRLDVLTFTAGVGENAPQVRAGAVAGLEGLGLEVDATRNTAASDQPRVISPDGARVTIMVVPTNEELAIARQARALTQERKTS